MGRKWVWVSAVAACGSVCLSVVMALGATAQEVGAMETMRVGGIVIVDRDGVERMHLGPVDLSTSVGDYGMTIVAGKRGSKASRLIVGVQAGGAQVVEMSQGTGGVRVVVGVDGEVRCEVRDKIRARIEVGMKPEGVTSVMVLRKDGTVVREWHEESGK